jgi:phage-related minor tail protein
MADRIKGITIELDGDTTKLSNALKGVNKEIRDTQSNLKDVNKLLKMDPGNADLLAQKQKYLTDAIDATKKKLARRRKLSHSSRPVLRLRRRRSSRKH